MPQSATMQNSSIPTVSRWKVILNVGRFVSNPIPLLDETIVEYGDSYITYLGGKTKTVITIDPKLIQHVMQKNHLNYEKSVIQTDLLARYIGKGLLTTNGSYWLRQRRLIQPGFHKQKLNALVEIMNNEITKYCGELLERIEDNPVMDMSAEMMKLTLRVVSRALFSSGIGEEDIVFLGKSITRLQHAIIKDIRQPFLKWWRRMNGYDSESVKIAKEAQQMISQIIESKKKSENRPDDLLDMLLNVRYEDTNEHMTDQQVLEECLVLFVAGHETSANAMAWMHYLLHQNPKEKDFILREIREVSEQIPDMQKAMGMERISMAVSETMRMYPPAWVTDRVALGDDEYKGMKINKGDIISPYIYGTHNDAKRWVSPEKFVPGRFAKDKRGQIGAFSYLPFGGGPRLCIGQQFALIEMQLIIFHLYKRFEFELIPNQKIELEPLVTLRPRYGIKMMVNRRMP